MSCWFAAVGMFFVLSGFVLVYAHGEIRLLDHRARRTFWRARFARVYPLYAYGMIFGAFVTFWLGWMHAKDFESLRGALRIAAVLAVLPGVSYRTMFLFNWAAWSLTSELLFYFLFPFLAEPLRRLSTRRLILLTSSLTLLTLTAVAVYSQLDPDHLGRPLRLGDETVVFGHYMKFFPLVHLHEFLWGMASGILWKRFGAYFKGVSSRKADVVLVATIFCGAAIALLSLDRFYLFLHSGLLAPLFASSIAWLASGRSVLSRLLSLRPFTLLGEASYAIYMLHVPLYLMLDEMLAPRFSPDARCCIFVATLIVMSIVTHYAWERPLRRLINERRASTDDVNADGVRASAHAERRAEHDDDAFAR